MSTDIMPARSYPATTVSNVARSALSDWATAMADAGNLATAIVKTDFVPAHFRGKTGDAAVAIMKGAALGMDPIASLESIYVINGKPALYGRAMAAVVLSAGHEIWTESASDTQVVVMGRRKGTDHVETSTWTLDRATTAGYVTNQQYKANPQAMLYSKAVAEVARRIAPDVLMGISYNVEELQLEQETLAPVKIKRGRKPAQAEKDSSIEAEKKEEITEENDEGKNA